LFGLIMVLTLTGSLSVAKAGRGEVRTLLVGALGCNLAWGIIDGVPSHDRFERARAWHHRAAGAAHRGCPGYKFSLSYKRFELSSPG